MSKGKYNIIIEELIPEKTTTGTIEGKPFKSVMTVKYNTYKWIHTIDGKRATPGEAGQISWLISKVEKERMLERLNK